MKHIAVLISLSLSAPVLAGEAPQGPPPAPVVVAQAEIRDIAPTLEVPGTVISRFDARLAAEVAGTITSIIDVGTHVAQGDALVRMDETDTRLQLDEARAAVASAEAQLRYLRSEAERLTQLAAQNNAAESQLEQRESERDVAASDLAVAQSRVARFEDQLRRSRLPAPFGGVVTERLLNMGERANVGDVLLRLVDPSRLEVIARSPIKSVGPVQPGDAIRVFIGEREAFAPVRTIVPFGDARSHMVELRIDVEADRWRVGESVRVAIPTAAPEDRLAVPRDAVVLRRGGAAVFKVVPGQEGGPSVAERVPVELGSADGRWISVIGGLVDGDTVIVRGAERLRPGQPVAPQPLGQR